MRFVVGVEVQRHEPLVRYVRNLLHSQIDSLLRIPAIFSAVEDQKGFDGFEFEQFRVKKQVYRKIHRKAKQIVQKFLWKLEIAFLGVYRPRRLVRERRRRVKIGASIFAGVLKILLKVALEFGGIPVKLRS